MPFHFFAVCDNVVAPESGLALDKHVISIAAWEATGEKKQTVVQSSFDEREEAGCCK